MHHVSWQPSEGLQISNTHQCQLSQIVMLAYAVYAAINLLHMLCFHIQTQIHVLYPFRSSVFGFPTRDTGLDHLHSCY